MRTTSMLLVGSAVAHVAMATTVAAQTAPRAVGTQSLRVVTNVCSELATSPSALVNSPEGMALMHRKRELESYAVTLERNQAFQREKVQEFSKVQRGVDSLMRVMVRMAPHDSMGAATIRMHGDSVHVFMRRPMEFRAFLPPDAEARGGTPRSIEQRITVEQRNVAESRTPLHFEATIRSLQPQIAALAEAAEAQLPSRSSPAGYMGVGLSGAQIRMVTPAGVSISHCEYPVVETVDGGSPAARAGLRTGDTVLAYNGRDLKSLAVNYASMLVPGEAVRMRIRRAGKTRELNVKVSERTDERAASFVRIGEALPLINGAPISPSMAPTAPPAPPVNVMLSGTNVGVYGGAQFSFIDEEFAERSGLEPGILVLRVLPGTPAHDAGLRPGEVVRTVNGAAVRSLVPLRRAFSVPGAREVTLGVMGRNAPSRTVVVRW